MSENRTGNPLHSQYEDGERTENSIRKGRHRNLVGAMWEEAGQHQLDFLRASGLRPEHRLLDLGCGCLRAGVKLIPYLDPGNYYGVDAERRLIEVGYAVELRKAGIQARLPRANLYTSRVFRHGRLEPASIDMGACVSVMTHLPLNFLRVCLENAGVYFKPGARLYLSFFELPEGLPFAQRHVNGHGVETFGHRDAYHYYAQDMVEAARADRWAARYVGDWAHPRGQAMVEYTRLG